MDSDFEGSNYSKNIMNSQWNIQILFIIKQDFLWNKRLILEFLFIDRDSENATQPPSQTTNLNIQIRNVPIHVTISCTKDNEPF